MEVNAAGYYVIPRYIGWEEFLIHTRDVLACGNKMLVQFSMKEGPVQVTDFQKENGLDLDNAWLFTVSGVGHTHTLIEDITNFKFIQFRPSTVWVAIHMGNTKRINLEQFEDIWISDTFRKLKPVIVLHQEKFWHVMGLELAVDEEDSSWYLYLKRQDSDFMTRIKMSPTQKFLYNPLSNSWALDDPTEEITDHEKIKEVLRKEGVWEVIVSGVPMNMIRVMNIAADILFFVFKDEEDKHRYYYARKSTKLRVVTDVNTREVKYLLDHVKAIHVD